MAAFYGYVIGLGANLGDRRATLRSAVLAMRQHGEVPALSHLYETAPVGPPQPPYLNAALLLHSELEPRALLEALLAIERRHGRERRERWGARTLDLDILFSPGLTVSEPALRIPHPELERRAFALLPLLDVMPDARDLETGRSYAQVMAVLGNDGVRRAETNRSWAPEGHLLATPGRTE